MNEQNFPSSIGTDAPVADTTAPKTCPNCNAVVTIGQKFCAKCGTEIPDTTPKPSVCRNCNAELGENAEFCPHCGTKQGEPTPVAPLKNKKNLKPLFIGIAAGAVVIIAVILFLIFRPIPVDYVELSQTTLEMTVDENVTVSCIIHPDNATETEVVWSSTDSTVASVNNYGRITAVGKGTCTIYASVDGKSASISVTVKPKGPDFKKLYNEIGSSVKYGFSVASDGSYLSADTNVYNTEDYFNYNIRDAITELHQKMGLPESLDEDMWQTSWSMGKQHETFENIGITVSWTYHPDKGLEVTYKLINQ